MKKYFWICLLIIFSVSLSGCTNPILGNSTGSSKAGGVMKSSDAGKTWEIKNKAGEKSNINKVEVYSMAIDPVDTNKIYLGTKDKGIAVSKNGAENWEKMDFPGNKVYGIAINHFNPGNIYASGVVGERGKLFRTDDYGESWNEIYTEPADGTVVTSLAMDKNNASVLYMGTSEGVVVKTVDGGVSWRNLCKAEDAVTKILFGGGTDAHIYFMVHEHQLVVSDREGNNFREITGNLGDEDVDMGTVASIAVVQNDNGGIYLGTDSGLFRSFDGGENLEQVNTIGSSRDFPVRSIAINPKNSQEIIYSGAQAIYKSVNGGKNWSTFQINTGTVVGNIVYNPSDVNIIYSGLRSFGN